MTSDFAPGQAGAGAEPGHDQRGQVVAGPDLWDALERVALTTSAQARLRISWLSIPRVRAAPPCDVGQPGLQRFEVFGRVDVEPQRRDLDDLGLEVGAAAASAM